MTSTTTAKATERAGASDSGAGDSGAGDSEADDNIIRRIEVASLGELLDLATPERPDPASGRLRDSAIYRGCADFDWSILTSLDRLGGIEPPHTKAELEEHILRNFLRYSRPYLDQPGLNHWEALVIAQHHGLPTRLLDWTYSPLVAAHFATLEESPAPNRVVWKLDWQKVHAHFGLRRVAFLVDDLGQVLSDRGLRSIWDLFRWQDDASSPFVCMMEPPHLDERLVSQSAAFTVCSSKHQALDQFLLDHGLGGALTKFVISGDRVDHVRDQLDLSGIDERRLFPDLGGVTAVMRRYYSMSPDPEGESEG